MNKQPQIWTRLLGENADVNKIADNVPDDSGNVSFAKLFGKITAVPLEKGGVAPEREDFNALFKLLGEVAYYFMHGGIYNYANNIDYDVGSFVRYNNQLFVCITANGPATALKAPSDLNYWANIKNAVKLATARTINIQDASGTNTGTGINFDGSSNEIIKLPENIKANLEGNSKTATKLATARTINIQDDLLGEGGKVVFDGSSNITIKLPPLIASQLLKDKTKNYGNDYYDDSDITSLIYAGNGSGTVRAELAAGNFERLHPGQYIKGRVTGTTYVVVGCNVYLNRGDTLLTRNHLGLIPIQLVGNSGSLLWSGQKWTGDATKNTTQGYAPWNADNETVGKNVTCAYKDSYMAKTVIPKVINNWLKKDFEDQGISVLTFRNLFSIGFDANLPCMSYPSWKGACTYAEWADCKAVLMSEPEVYGGYRWASSPYESHMQHLQLPIFRHRSIHEIIVADIWLKDSASVSLACLVGWTGFASLLDASFACRVCPLFLIA